MPCAPAPLSLGAAAQSDTQRRAPVRSCSGDRRFVSEPAPPPWRRELWVRPCRAIARSRSIRFAAFLPKPLFSGMRMTYERLGSRLTKIGGAFLARAGMGTKKLPSYRERTSRRGYPDFLAPAGASRREGPFAWMNGGDTSERQYRIGESRPLLRGSELWWDFRRRIVYRRSRNRGYQSRQFRLSTSGLSLGSPRCTEAGACFAEISPAPRRTSPRMPLPSTNRARGSG